MLHLQVISVVTVEQLERWKRLIIEDQVEHFHIYDDTDVYSQCCTVTVRLDKGKSVFLCCNLGMGNALAPKTTKLLTLADSFHTEGSFTETFVDVFIIFMCDTAILTLVKVE